MIRPVAVAARTQPAPLVGPLLLCIAGAAFFSNISVPGLSSYITTLEQTVQATPTIASVSQRSRESDGKPS
jgi:hypothetical protein